MKNSIKNSINSDEQAAVHDGYREINWVGMSKIQSCIMDQGQMIPAELDMHVSLRSGYRGIHMSRLYELQMNEFSGQMLTVQQLDHMIKQSIISQEGIAERARMRIRFHSLVRTRSLKTDTQGFRSYPVQIVVSGDGQGLNQIITKFEILYSSTCPQSAKLSKEYFKQSFSTPEDLQRWYDSTDVYPATPHAQRSRMTVEIVTLKDQDFQILNWIQQIEDVLKTTVQTTVKKADEMEFARLNAENTMFCEDAVRKIADFLDFNKVMSGYRLTAEHFESLHSHDATSQISKNFAGL